MTSRAACRLDASSTLGILNVNRAWVLQSGEGGERLKVVFTVRVVLAVI